MPSNYNNKTLQATYSSEAEERLDEEEEVDEESIADDECNSPILSILISYAPDAELELSDLEGTMLEEDPLPVLDLVEGGGE